MGIGFLFFKPLIVRGARNQASALNTEVGVFKGPALSRVLLSGPYTTEVCCLTFPQRRGVQVVGDGAMVAFNDKACPHKFQCTFPSPYSTFISVFRRLIRLSQFQIMTFALNYEIFMKNFELLFKLCAHIYVSEDAFI